MDYKLRNLKTNDIFPMSKILKKMGLKIETEGKTQQQLGAELIMQVFENLHMAQDEVNEFMGSLVGITGKEFGELPIEQSINIIQEFKNLPNIMGFFNLASKLTK